MFQAGDLTHTTNSTSAISIEYGEDIVGGTFTDTCYNVQYPQAWENGFVQLEYIRTGMMIALFDFTLPQALSVNVETEDTPLTFGVVTSGGYELEYRNGQGRSTVHTTHLGEGIGRHNSLSGKLHIPAHIPCQMMTVSISDALVEGMLYDHEEYYTLQKQLSNKHETLQNIGTFKLSPALCCIVSQIRHCSLQGKSRSLYLESKALEIIALQLAQLQNRSQGHSFAANSIQRADIEKLHEARQLLFESLEDPPSIHDLALKVGLNDFRLKQGFKKLFNTTISGSLHKHRMEIARMHFLEGEITVTEVASSIDYTNISHFIAAFRKQYAVNPGELLKNTKQHRLVQRDYKERPIHNNITLI